jgi:hypothetical protein
MSTTEAETIVTGVDFVSVPALMLHHRYAPREAEG